MLGEPFFGGRKVAHAGLEPDVDALVLVALERDRDAPRQVARDRAVGQSFAQHAEREVADVGASKIVLEAPKVEIPEGCSLSPQIGVTGSISTPTGGVITFTDGILTNLST